MLSACSSSSCDNSLSSGAGGMSSVASVYDVCGGVFAVSIPVGPVVSSSSYLVQFWALVIF